MAPWDALLNGQPAVKRGNNAGIRRWLRPVASLQFCEVNIVGCKIACEKF